MDKANSDVMELMKEVVQETSEADVEGSESNSKAKERIWGQVAFFTTPFQDHRRKAEYSQITS